MSKSANLRSNATPQSQRDEWLERRQIRKKWHRGTFRHVLAIMLMLLGALIALVVMVLGQFFLGDSQAASDSVVQTLHQSSALKFVPYLYLYEHVAESLERGNVADTDMVTDTSRVTVRKRLVPTGAETQIRFTLTQAAAEDTLIPAGTRVTNEAGQAVFATLEDAMIAAGETAVTVAARCETTGEIGNGIAAGELNRCLSEISDLASCENIEVTAGGIDVSEPEEAKEYGKDSRMLEEGVYLVNVNGATFHGYMMIVQDPSRVFLGTCTYNKNAGIAYGFTEEKEGKKVDDIMRLYGAAACINAGAFSDPNGSGNGGMAEGLVITQGKTLKGHSKTYKYVAGFDKNDILHVGNFTRAQAEEMGLRDACAFGPALIINGEASLSKDNGLNPRTAIGQREDGAVLLLVIDGRQANSMGATISDVINVMLDFGAVNACNMDGGSSTIMYYGSEKINDGMTVSVSRRMPTAWLVK